MFVPGGRFSQGWLSAFLVAFCVVSSNTAQAQLTNASMGQSGDSGSTRSEARSSDAARDTEDGDPEDIQAGGLLGYAHLDDVNYVAPTLSADVRFHFFQAAVRIPLRLRFDSGDLRKKDWDELGDYFRVAQCVRMDFSEHGRFEREHGLCLPWDVERDDYYFSVRLGPQYDLTLAHGTILNSFSNNINPDHFHPGALAQWQFHQFVVGNFVIDNVVDPSILGGTLALRPFAYESEETDESYESQHQLQLNVSAVTDMRAPLHVRTAFGRALTDDASNLLYTRSPVTVVGADFQYKYVFGTQVAIEAHADWNYITGHGMGTHGQLWFIYNHPDGDYSVRGQGEFRYIQRDYIPNYFDSYYAVQREQYGLTPETQGTLGLDGGFATKREFLDSLAGGQWQGGYQGGVTFEAFRGSGDDRRTALLARFYIGDTFGRRNDGQFVLSLQIPRLANKIDVYGLYSRQNFNNIADIFKVNNTLVKLIVRWDLDERFYVLINYGRLWQLQVEEPGRSLTGYRSSDDFGISLGILEGL